MPFVTTRRPIRTHARRTHVSHDRECFRHASWPRCRNERLGSDPNSWGQTRAVRVRPQVCGCPCPERPNDTRRVCHLAARRHPQALQALQTLPPGCDMLPGGRGHVRSTSGEVEGSGPMTPRQPAHWARCQSRRARWLGGCRALRGAVPRTTVRTRTRLRSGAHRAVRVRAREPETTPGRSVVWASTRVAVVRQSATSVHTPYPARAAAACRHGGVREHDRTTAARATRGRLGARPQAQPRRADQARQGAARDPRRAAGADRRRLRAASPRRTSSGSSGGASTTTSRRSGRSCCASSCPAGIVDAGAAARDRRGLEPLRPRRRRARRHARTSSSTGSSSRRCPTSSRDLDAAGHHDRRRLRRHGAQHHRLPGRRASPHDELFDATPVVEEAAEFFYGNPDYSEPAAQAQVSRSRPAPTAATRPRSTASRSSARSTTAQRGLRRARRRRALVGAAHRARPRRLRAEGRGDRGARARSLDAWARGPQLPRLARQGAAQVHGRRHRPRGHARARRGAARPHARPTSRCRRSTRARATTSACTRRSRTGSRYIGVPVHLGLISGDQMIARRRPRRARRRRRPHHAPAELHRHRTSPDDARRRRRSPSSREIGFPLDVNRAARRLDRLHRRAALQLLGRPRRRRASDALIEHLEARFGDADRRPAPAPRRLPARVRAALGRRPRLPGHDRARRGRQARARPTTSSCAAALGPDAAIARPLFRRVPTEELDAAVAGLVARLARRRARDGETFRAFCAPHDRRRARRSRPGSSPPRDAYERRRHEHVELLDELEAGELSVEFEGEEPRGAARVGDRAVRAAHRDLDRVPDRRRRADRHGVRASTRTSASSASTPAACRRRRSS